MSKKQIESQKYEAVSEFFDHDEKKKSEGEIDKIMTEFKERKREVVCSTYTSIRH